MLKPRIPELEARIEDYEAAIATFARLHEELTDLRENVSLPEAAMRLDTMLKLNAETLHAIKHSLTIALVALKRIRSQPVELVTAGR